jgi:hypothetical protein
MHGTHLVPCRVSQATDDLLKKSRFLADKLSMKPPGLSHALIGSGFGSHVTSCGLPGSELRGIGGVERWESGVESFSPSESLSTLSALS